MKIKDITEWSERWSNLILGLAPGKRPDDNPDYQNHQEYSGPNSGLEDIADHLTASRATAETNKSTKRFIGILRLRLAPSLFILARDAYRAIPFPN